MRLDFFRQMNGFRDIFCSGDFEFDNRARFVSAPIVDDMEIVADRRVQANSLTNGAFRMGTPARDADTRVLMESLEQIKRRPTMATARSLGKLELVQENACATC